MKKTFNLRNVLALSITAAMLAGTAAFAEETKETEKEVTPISETSEETPVTDNAPEATKATDYLASTGKITSIEKHDDYTSISVDDRDGFVMDIKNDVLVADGKDGSLKTVEDLKEGMDISAYISGNAPMTMSLPPIVNDVAVIVINSEDSFNAIHRFDNSLVSEDNTLALNIGKDTAISSITGEKKKFTEADVKGAEAIVIYGAATRSIPAQTTPSRVIILEEEEAQLTGLRALAEGEGYSVKWTSNNEPVVIAKDGVEIKATLDSAVVEKTDANGVKTSTVLKEAVYLENSTMMVSTDFEAFLK